MTGIISLFRSSTVRRHISLAMVVLSAATISPLSIGSASDARLAAYGRYLARECTSCHRLDGVDNGIPSIVGWPAEMFMATMKFYQDGSRTNPVMVSVASSLDEKQLEALATFFAAQPKPATASTPATKARKP